MMNSVSAGPLLFLLFVGPSFLFADEELKNPQPVPRLQVLPLPDHEASVTDEGLEFTRYHFGSRFGQNVRRPFLYPLIGPSGRSVSRMGHPHDPESHSHHNSVWISHHDVNGIDFWSDRGERVGSIFHQRTIRFEDSNNEALIQVANGWDDGETDTILLDEIRSMRFRRSKNGNWLCILDLELSARWGAVTLGKTPFGLVGVRMAKTIGVNDGGGRILNSAGGHDEAEVFWKPAKWVDYAGPITKDHREGITLFDHPSNPNHPSVFHVRNDGWMGASLTFDGERIIEPAKPLKLRYGLWVHSGVLDQATIEKEYAAFVEKAGDPPAIEKK
jgi:hypothetical protein